jgi:hypothetical protein
MLPRCILTLSSLLAWLPGQLPTAPAPPPSDNGDELRRAMQREAMRHVSVGLRAAPRGPVDPERLRRRQVNRTMTLQLVLDPELEATDPADRLAIDAFAKAAALGTQGSEAVLGVAVSGRRPDERHRALLGVLRAWQPGAVLGSDRTGELLRGLIDDPDDELAAIACSLLGRQLRTGYSAPLAELVRAAEAAWPEDPRELVPAAGLAPAEGMAEYSWGGTRLSRLILLAMHSGASRLALRIAEPPPEGSTADEIRKHAHFTLEALAIAAPRLDAATAAKVHAWYIPHLHSWDRQVQQLTTWHCGVLAVLTWIHPQLPPHLLPSYAPMRDWELVRRYVDGKLGGLHRAP